MFSCNWRSPPGINRVSSPSTLVNSQYGTYVVGKQPVSTYLLNSQTFSKKTDVVDLEEVQCDYEEEGDGVAFRMEANAMILIQLSLMLSVRS